jgi:DNA-binding CsgD family transcriptional regulator/tetratricopeptide (TPR) repeat protein
MVDQRIDDGALKQLPDTATPAELVEHEQPALAPLLQTYSPLALRVRRVTGSVVGRPIELSGIQQELVSAESGRLAALTVEGEPGIGKTRLLLAAREIAAARGFITIAVAADEELRGPFLLARSIVGSPDAAAAAPGSAAETALSRSVDALSGRDDPGLGSLPPDQKLLRSFDLAAIAIRSLAEHRPVALLIDDFQWADEDSLRLLRYIVRADAASPLFLMMTIRPEELAFVNEAVTLLADMERLGMVRRFRLSRFTQVETAELLKQVLAGTVQASGAAAMHVQAEGVPFIVEELAQAYRDAGMLQQIDGMWSLAKNAERLVPSAVRTLISRRAARLPEETKTVLAKAAVLGRHFSLKDLREVLLRVDDTDSPPDSLADALTPGVDAGLLVQHTEGSAADYSFAHEQVREFAAAALTPTKRRATHAAIVELLLAGDPAAESLPLLAHHARAAGDATVCVRFSKEATRNALDAHAPEEVLRVVDLALPAASTPQDRVSLLEARDEALDMLRRSEDRLEGLAELAALAEALGDLHLELHVQLRRAAALRASEEHEGAAELARRVRELAASRGDKQAELAACLELGQALLTTPLGEGATVSPHDGDLDGGEEAYARAAVLAEELGDEALLAATIRELGVIDLSRLRAWFVERIQAGEHHAVVARAASGEPLDKIIEETPVAPLARSASQRFQRALELFEKIGDRRGAMSTIIAMAYLNWGPDIHLGPGAARHIEEIRRLSSRMQSLTRESERALAEGQMLYGVHVFSRAKVIPDLALSRGEETYRHARRTGDRSLEFVGAGGTALAYLDLGEIELAKTWLDRAAASAAEAPTPLRARQLETWRGMVMAAAEDAGGMRTHLERAVQLATEQGRPAARCEALARLAIEAARLGAKKHDEELLDLAERSAIEAKGLMELLPGHPPWGAQADAALAEVALSRGETEQALDAARSAFDALESAMHEDLYLDVVRPVARAILAGGSEAEQQTIQLYLSVMLATIAQRTLDEEIRVNWFRGPVGRELAGLVGMMESIPEGQNGQAGPTLELAETALLRLLMEGRTNKEIAEEMGESEELVARRLGEMFARIGASSRAEATVFAFREKVV